MQQNFSVILQQNKKRNHTIIQANKQNQKQRKQKENKQANKKQRVCKAFMFEKPVTHRTTV